METIAERPNLLNVYSGPDSLKKYFDPDILPPLPLVELPPYLNPYYDDGVRIYAKMMSMHPANNVKAIPVTNMLSKHPSPERTRTIVEYSSGSTVISMSMIARVMHGVNDTQAFLSNKTSSAKLRLMQFFGLGITLFGGPSQPEPTDERGGIKCAQSLAADRDSGIVNLNQYENDENWRGHVRWTGPQILKQLPHINVICAGMGTSGTMTGLGMYFKEVKPEVYRLGVCTAAGDRVPGPRSHALLSPVKFPWREAVDSIEHVGSYDSFTLSLDLCREGLICGPSSGFNLKGLFQMIEKRKASDTLKDLAGPDGSVHCVFLCCDLPYQYIDEYFEKLGSEKFQPIQNERLQKVDLYRYDEAWERVAEDCVEQYYDSFQGVTFDSPIVFLRGQSLVIDLRQSVDFSDWHAPGAVNFPLDSVGPAIGSPFSDSKVLEAQWLELEKMFTEAGILDKIGGYRVLLVCYDGDTSRVATSVLRAKGIEANSVKGGSRELARLLTTENQKRRKTRGDSVIQSEDASEEEL